MIAQAKKPAKPVYCKLCGHGWFMLAGKKPRQCPKCWSRNWDKGPKK